MQQMVVSYAQDILTHYCKITESFSTLNFAKIQTSALMKLFLMQACQYSNEIKLIIFDAVRLAYHFLKDKNPGKVHAYLLKMKNTNQFSVDFSGAFIDCFTLYCNKPVDQLLIRTSILEKYNRDDSSIWQHSRNQLTENTEKKLARYIKDAIEQEEDRSSINYLDILEKLGEIEGKQETMENKLAKKLKNQMIFLRDRVTEARVKIFRDKESMPELFLHLVLYFFSASLNHQV